MNGRNLLADTNFLIRFLNGDARVQPIVLDNEIFFSFINELELYAKHGLSAEEEAGIASLVAGSTVLPYEPAMKEIVIQIRRAAKVKLPDAIIAATAIFHSLPLLTSDAGFRRIAGLQLLAIQ